jgi:(2Fe-2S) ferredoxin
MGQFDRHVFVCTHGEYCPLQGSIEIHRLLKQEIAARGLKDVIRINKSGCFSQCGNGPMLVVYPDDVWYGGVDEAAARRILEGHLVGGRPVEGLLYRAPRGPNKNATRMAALAGRRTVEGAPRDGGS